MGNGMKINKFSADEIDRLLDDGNTPDMCIFWKCYFQKLQI